MGLLPLSMWREWLALDGGAAVIMQEVGCEFEKKLQHERLRPGGATRRPEGGPKVTEPRSSVQVKVSSFRFQVNPIRCRRRNPASL